MRGGGAVRSRRGGLEAKRLADNVEKDKVAVLLALYCGENCGENWDEHTLPLDG